MVTGGTLTLCPLCLRFTVYCYNKHVQQSSQKVRQTKNKEDATSILHNVLATFGEKDINNLYAQ